MTEHRQKLCDVCNDPTETRDPCRWFLKKHPNPLAPLGKGFIMHVGFCTKEGMRYMHCDIEVSNEDIKESDVEDGETIEGGTQSAYLEKWKFSSSADEGSFSKICCAILHPILFRRK